MAKNKLLTFLSLVVGSQTLLTPFFAFHNTTSLSNKQIKSAVTAESNSINEHGINLSTYHLEGWKGSVCKIKVLNNNTPITNNIKWNIQDTSKVSIDPQCDAEGNYSVNIISNYIENETNETKIQAVFTDSNGYQHKSTCVVKILHIFTLSVDNKNPIIKLGSNTTIELFQSNNLKPDDFDFETSDEYGIMADVRLTSRDSKILLNVKTEDKQQAGVITVKIYYKTEKTSRSHQLVLNITSVNNELKLSSTNISARVTDKINIEATLNDVATTQDKLTWTSSNPSVCNFELDKDSGKINLVFLQASLEPIQITCYEKNTGLSNYVVCYVNVTDSHLAITPKDKTSFKYLDKQVQLSATLDGESVSANNITWVTSDSTIAEVDETGLVKFIGVGVVKITAIYKTVYSVSITDEIQLNIVANVLSAIEDITVLTSTPSQKLVVKLDGQEIQNPAEKLSFSSSNEEIVTVDKLGNLTFHNAGHAKITCWYTDSPLLPSMETITNIHVLVPESEFKLEFNDKAYGIYDKDPHKLPGAYIGDLFVPLEYLKWTGPEQIKINDDGTINCADVGDYVLTCTFQTSLKTYSLEFNVHFREVFLDGAGNEITPTLNTQHSKPFTGDSYQLNFYLDSDLTQQVPIKTIHSTNNKIVSVDQSGKISCRGHGSADVVCEISIPASNNNELITKYVLHVRIRTKWFEWFIPIISLLIIAAGITTPLVIIKKKKTGKNNKK